jgi:beta-lactamase regulating signal transducer with metallopeptidase domain
MASEWIELLLRVNLALAAGVAVVMAVRPLARRYFGARIAYGLWLLPLAAAAMCFAPQRVEHVVLEPVSAPLGRAAPVAIETVAAQPPYLLWAWIAGALLSIVVLALRQARFTMALGRLHKRDDLGQHVCAAESCEHGPAVIGVLRPIIITPADFDSRFDAEERRIVLAHERAHMAQGDPWINVLVVLLQCVNWFNPFVHIGARALRVDQELACDAAVLAQSDGIRRRYAEAMLKTHIAASAPIGCAWPPSDLNALKERIAMLKRNLPSRTQTLLGGAAIVVATAGIAAAAWAAQPARIVTTVAVAAPAAALDGKPTRSLESLAPLESMETFEALASLEGLASLESLASLEALVSLDDLDVDVEIDEDDLMSGEARVVRDGVTIRYEDLSPEERAEIRRSLDQARVARDQARVQVREARDQARVRVMEARDQERAARAVARTHGDDAERIHDAREAAQEAREAAQEAREAEREARQEQIEAEREARAEAAEARAEAMVEVREAMLEMENELARLGPEERAHAREALREAHSEIARELQRARARGDADEIEALEIAERSLRSSMRNGN